MKLGPVSWLRACLLAGILACAQGGGSGPGALSRLPASDPARRPARVVMISVAGLSPAHYGAGEGPVAAGTAVMPRLAQLAARGAYAQEMEAVFPSAPYPVHATLVTGLRPDRHQVLGDELLGRQGVHIRGIADERRIRGLPLWRAAQAAGLSVAALNWPSTRGADIALLLPDMGVPGTEPDLNWLEDLTDEATPWVVERLRRLDEKLPETRWPTIAMRDSLVERLACEIAKQPVTPSLWLLTFEQSATAIAQDGPGSDGARAALSEVDSAIGRLLDCFEAEGIRDSTAWLVVGDRSLFPIHTLVYPNVLLERIGLITPSTMRSSGISSWHAYVRSFGGAAVVYAQDEADALLARRALEEQATLTRAFRIVSAGELLSLHTDPDAWFGLQGLAGYGIGKSARGQLLQATERRGLGGYLPNKPGSAVGFVAWGAGVRSGVRVPETSQVDVAPTAASLLGFDLPGADGTPLIGILGR